MAKQWVSLMMRAAGFPVFCLYLIGRPLLGDRRAFASVMQWVSLFPGMAGEWYRRGILQWVTRMPMTDACISFGVLFSDPGIRIEDGVYIGPRCDIGKASIRKNTMIASNVQILSGLNQHRFEEGKVPVKDQTGEFKRVSIGENSWVGSQSLIGADIGNGCIIGAGSVVVRPVPDDSVALGNPARVVRSRADK